MLSVLSELSTWIDSGLASPRLLHLPSNYKIKNCKIIVNAKVSYRTTKQDCKCDLTIKNTLMSHIVTLWTKNKSHLTQCDFCGPHDQNRWMTWRQITQKLLNSFNKIHDVKQNKIKISVHVVFSSKTFVFVFMMTSHTWLTTYHLRSLQTRNCINSWSTQKPPKRIVRVPEFFMEIQNYA